MFSLLRRSPINVLSNIYKVIHILPMRPVICVSYDDYYSINFSYVTIKSTAIATSRKYNDAVGDYELNELKNRFGGHPGHDGPLTVLQHKFSR